MRKQLIIALFAFGAAFQAQALSDLNFNDLSGNKHTNIDQYGGYEWVGFEAETGAGGKEKSLVAASDNNISTIRAADGSLFDFYSADLGAWNNTGATVTISGWLDDNEVYSQSLTLTSKNLSSFDFNYTGIDTLTFAASNFNGQKSFVMDNMTMASAVPEPATYAMMAGSLGILGWVLRRRKKI